jgi:methylmalonyl-CoA epimerase
VTTPSTPAASGTSQLATTPFRRLDHVGIAVWDADLAIPYYRDVLGLPLVGDEDAPEPGTRLVYFEVGGAFLQLVQPVSEDCNIRDWLREHGEGVHHVCLAVEDLSSITRLRPDDPEAPIFQAGRDRHACFLTNTAPQGTLIEVTELHRSR